MGRDKKPIPEPPTHTPMILMAIFVALLCTGLVYALCKRLSMKSVFHPKIWLLLFGVPFSILPVMSWAPALDLGENDCAAQWDFSNDKDGKQLLMCTRYEIVWAALLMAHGSMALSFAVLHEGQTRAKLALTFGLVMLCAFFPGLLYATQGYDIKPPTVAYFIMAGLFGGIALSGFLHLHTKAA
mmetsp:Transcript_42413/g.76007  ORF Transcript_42413/g.76007 Transcript_42413/m.76007 type:complete len:184 (-) Transcript_42413:42-593(-)